VRKRYRYADMMTLYEKLKSLSNAERFLKPGMSFAALDAYARASSDNEVAAHMNAARQAVSVHRTSIQAAGRLTWQPPPGPVDLWSSPAANPAGALAVENAYPFPARPSGRKLHRPSARNSTSEPAGSDS
jgi:hypothetical protein